MLHLRTDLTVAIPASTWRKRALSTVSNFSSMCELQRLIVVVNETLASLAIGMQGSSALSKKASFEQHAHNT